MSYKSSTYPTAVLGIVAALQRETKPLTNLLLPPRTPVKIAEQVYLIVSGMGPQRAGSAVKQLEQLGATALVSWGTAAALDPALAAGTLCIPDTISDSNRNTYGADKQWLARLRTELSSTTVLTNSGQAYMPLKDGKLTSRSHVIATPEEKQQLFKRYGELALDMESAAIAHQAQISGLPFVVIRAIVDTADMVLPNSVLGALDNDGKPNILKLISGLLFHPQDFLPLMHLSKSFKAAEKTLQSTIKSLGVTLAMPEPPKSYSNKAC